LLRRPDVQIACLVRAGCRFSRGTDAFHCALDFGDFLCSGRRSPSPAEARRVALVIGNSSYKIGALQNPVNDATAVAEVFERTLRFDRVILKKDLDGVCRRLTPAR